MEVVKHEFYHGEWGIFVGFNCDTFALTHQSAVEVLNASAFLGIEAFALLIVDTLSHVVDSLQPNLEFIEATFAVFVAVDRNTDLGLGHVALEFVAVSD